MFRLIPYNTALVTTAGFALTSVAQALNSVRDNTQAEINIPSLTPPEPSSAMSEWLLNGYMGDFLEWAGEQLANIGQEVIHTPSISESKQAMRVNKRVLERLFTEALLDENVQKEIPAILAAYLRHGVVLINADELPPEKWQVDLEKLIFLAERAGEIYTASVLRDWKEHLGLLQNKYEQEWGAKSEPAFTPSSTFIYPAVFDVSALNGTNGFKMTSSALYGNFGDSVSGAGDVNGDGFDDLIIGAPHENHFNGTSYVVFGQASGFPSIWDVSNLNGINGFKMISSVPSSFGDSVSGAGDVNGDGFDDLIIGGYRGNNFNGTSYVVFGQKSGFPSVFDISALNGTNGFKMTSNALYGNFGSSVSGAGDVNGDGIDDLIIGAPSNGTSYVVFGRVSGFSSVWDVSALNGTNGFKITSSALYGNFGNSVSGAGDVNKDGFDDLIIGADEENDYNGASYVIFGKGNDFTSVLDVSILNGSNGFRIIGAKKSYFGTSVSGAGDVNGDGFDDLIIGAYAGNIGTGTSYVIFGKENGFANVLDVAKLNGSDGFKMINKIPAGNLGYSVSNAGDIDENGFCDLIISAPHDSGTSYVIFGQANAFPSVLDVSTLNGANGFEMTNDAVADGNFGNSVSGAGDVNGDGIVDLIIGAPSENNNEGASYVVFGGKIASTTSATNRLGVQGKAENPYGFFNSPTTRITSELTTEDTKFNRNMRLRK